MKKVILNTLIMGLAIMLPVVVMADENETSNNTTNTTNTVKLVISVPEKLVEVGEDIDSTNKTRTKTYDLVVNSNIDAEVKEVVFKFEYAKDSATIALDCKEISGGKYVVSEKGNPDDNPLTCTFAIPTGKEAPVGKTFKVGQLVQTVDIEASEDDCNVNYYLESNKANPKTGISIPYTLIVGGIAAAGVIYFATQKKNKMYKI